MDRSIDRGQPKITKKVIEAAEESQFELARVRAALDRGDVAGARDELEGVRLTLRWVAFEACRWERRLNQKIYEVQHWTPADDGDNPDPEPTPWFARLAREEATQGTAIITDLDAYRQKRAAA